MHVDRRLLLNHLRAQSDDILINKREHTFNVTESNETNSLNIITFVYIYFVGIVCATVCLLLEIIIYYGRIYIVKNQELYNFSKVNNRLMIKQQYNP